MEDDDHDSESKDHSLREEEDQAEDSEADHPPTKRGRDGPSSSSEYEDTDQPPAKRARHNQDSSNGDKKEML
jgi:hypothetical protein